MVDVVSTISSAQNTVLKPSVQSASVATAAPAAPSSNIDFVVSGIYVNNLQNVAILEYRSSQTGQVLQQYPNQAQINAFKAAERLAQQASDKQPSAPAPDEVHQSAAPAPQTQQTSTAADHVAAAPVAPSGSASGSSGDSSDSGGKTTSVVA